MAEKYGNIPEKYTKAWWEYYWEYYKWYVIVPLALIIAIGATIYSKVTAPKYDLSLTYAANNIISDENETKLVKKLSAMCEDVDKNGESSLFFSQLYIQADPKQEDLEYSRGASEKLQLGFEADEKYIYIMDKEVAELYVGTAPDECPYAPVEDWAENLPEGVEFLSAHGVNYGVSLSGNSIFESCEIDLTDHYVLIRYAPRKDQEKEQLPGYKAAINLANEIIAAK